MESARTMIGLAGLPDSIGERLWLQQLTLEIEFPPEHSQKRCHLMRGGMAGELTSVT